MVKTLRFAPARSPFRSMTAAERCASLQPSISSASPVYQEPCYQFLMNNYAKPLASISAAHPLAAERRRAAAKELGRA